MCGKKCAVCFLLRKKENKASRSFLLQCHGGKNDVFLHKHRRREGCSSTQKLCLENARLSGNSETYLGQSKSSDGGVFFLIESLKKASFLWTDRAFFALFFYAIWSVFN